MLTRIAHRIVSNPKVYDLVQVAAGARPVDRRLSARIEALPEPGTVLDMGGGTGIHRGLFPSGSTYVCLDSDPLKLERFVERNPDGAPILGDATCAPLPDESMDVVLCTFVAHHLPDELLDGFFGEIRRVLKRDGAFIFMDPLWVPSRWIGRLLWRFDQGEFPRTAEVLERAVADRFEITDRERFAVYHEYILLVARRNDLV